MGRIRSCFDNAAAEAFFSSLEREVLSRNGRHRGYRRLWHIEKACRMSTRPPGQTESSSNTADPAVNMYGECVESAFSGFRTIQRQQSYCRSSEGISAVYTPIKSPAIYGSGLAEWLETERLARSAAASDPRDAQLTHRGTAKWTHLMEVPYWAHHIGMPKVGGCKSLPAMGCCAVAPSLSQGWLTWRSPINGPVGTHTAFAAQIRVLWSASNPKT